MTERRTDTLDDALPHPVIVGMRGAVIGCGARP